MNQRKCKICGAAFTPKQFNQVICSFQCKKENSRRRSFAYSVFSREIVKWKPKEIECGFCHKRFLPTNSSQGLHTECRILKKQFYTVLNYFQICTKYRLIFMTNMLEHKSQTTTQGRDHLDLFYSYKNWCDICKNKINENRRANKPSKTEKFIYECLKKHFPDDNIVLVGNRCI
ncbi:MAG: hypothetical protein NTV07_04350 [Candidatus Omnitrophica bacterium]|nr:hypothetical protein [Candidatus Omnitrophota bacterium]